MLNIAAWTLWTLGLGHIGVGLIFFRPQFAAALGAGWFGQFQGVPAHRLAFWFIAFGPLLMLGGHVAVHAVAIGDLTLLRLIGWYLAALALLGVTALPRSPFWAALLLAPVFIAGGQGRLG